jgi:hypothetical protein
VHGCDERARRPRSGERQSALNRVEREGDGRGGRGERGGPSPSELRQRGLG